MDAAENSVAEAIDGATGDWSIAADAMRWSPELAERGPAGGELPGLDVAVGNGTGLGPDMDAVRRLVSGALTSLGTVVTDVVSEFRQLSLGSSSEDGEHPER